MTQCTQLPATLAPLPLKYLALELFRNDLPERHQIKGRKSRFNTIAIAVWYAKKIPTLEYLAISGLEFSEDKPLDKQQTYWRVYRDERHGAPGKPETQLPVPQVVRLDNEDGSNAEKHYDWSFLSALFIGASGIKFDALS